MEEKISVLMSVYKNDKPEWFRCAIDSVINQTYAPDEIVLIIDGPIGESLEEEINKVASINKLVKVYRNENNLGLGKTLNRGIMLCNNEIIARMDSDDYSVPTRFEEEIKFLNDTNSDVVGSNVTEFTGEISNVIAIKKVPSNEKEVQEYAKLRNPLCHPTVMLKKSKVLEAGNYLDMKLFEDYYLWIRMLQKGMKLNNISKSLVYMRTSEDMYARRGGYKYFKNQKKLLKYMKKTKFINLVTYLKSLFIRFIVQVLMTKNIRKKFYIKKIREKEI